MNFLSIIKVVKTGSYGGLLKSIVAPLGFLVLGFWVLAGPGIAASPGEKIYLVESPEVKVRSGPSMDYPFVRTMKAGDAFKSQGDPVGIWIPMGKGEYISKKHVRQIQTSQEAESKTSDSAPARGATPKPTVPTTSTTLSSSSTPEPAAQVSKPPEASTKDTAKESEATPTPAKKRGSSTVAKRAGHAKASVEKTSRAGAFLERSAEAMSVWVQSDLFLLLNLGLLAVCLIFYVKRMVKGPRQSQVIPKSDDFDFNQSKVRRLALLCEQQPEAMEELLVKTLEGASESAIRQVALLRVLNVIAGIRPEIVENMRSAHGDVLKSFEDRHADINMNLMPVELIEDLLTLEAPRVGAPNFQLRRIIEEVPDRFLFQHLKSILTLKEAAVLLAVLPASRAHLLVERLPARKREQILEKLASETWTLSRGDIFLLIKTLLIRAEAEKVLATFRRGRGGFQVR